MPLPLRSGRSLAAVLLLYVLPLGATVVALVAVGLPVLAVGLVVVELGVVGAIALARRPPRPVRTTPAGEPRTTSGSVVLLVLGAVVLGVVLLLLAARPG